MKHRLWQAGLCTLSAAILAACGGGDASPTSAAASTRSTALASKWGAEGRVDPADGSGKSPVRNDAYIVRLADDPVTAYRGGVKGYTATRPAAGRKIDPDAPAVVAYMGYLSAKQDAALAAVGGGRKLYNYGYVFNGFAADLTEAQAQKLASMPGVVAVSKDQARELETSTTPAFLGLSDPSTGFWANYGKGENIVIGMVDSGIWPEHPSFSDRTGANGNDSKTGKLGYQQLPGWHGKCIPGEQFDASNCNQKLIGARYYNAGFGGNAGIDRDLPFEFNSPRDHNGHGSHTASTAGGNAGVPATGLMAGFGAINGIAPRARLSVYKTCWSVPGTAGSCFGSDSIAAIDQAVADGVDVINYSISGSQTNFRDPVEIAFLYAADAGVFVATSAGNSGPTASTVAHPGPWVTTVAAGTHNRAVQGGSATLGNGMTFYGSGNVTPLGPLPLAYGADAGLAGVDPATLALCFGASDDGVARLDPAKVAGKIVVCERGGNALVNKSQAVKDAGGLGIIILNTPNSASTTPFVSYAIPGVHLAVDAYAPIRAYMATSNPVATINAADIVTNAPAPFIASFSSRGPLRASSSLIKPDLTAPGQDILAAVAPPGNGGKLFDLYSGTSMSSPHVAGLAALMKEAHPGWSPMAIKSALMTTGYDVLDANVSTATRILRQGAGHVAPLKAVDPGLVFDSGFNDWLNFICGTQPGSFCSAFKPINPSDLNLASIAMGSLAGSQTVTRTVTNVGSSAETYTASIAGLTGMALAPVAPIVVPKGGKAAVSLTFTRTDATLNAYTGGQLTLTGDKGHVVRVPVLARPVALAAPLEVGGSYDVTFGYTGPFTATARGLVAADTPTGAVATNAVQDFPVTIPAGTTYARFALFDADVSQASDLDLEVYNANGTLVASSGSGTSTEEANLVNPAAGTYRVRVIGYAVPNGAASFTLFNWVLGSSAAVPANMTVTAPASAVQGPGTIQLTFDGLLSGKRYLGSVAYGGVAGLPSPTIVRVDQP